MRFKIKKKCILCPAVFEIWNNAKRVNLTCGRKCSRVYSDIHRKENGRKQRERITEKSFDKALNAIHKDLIKGTLYI